MNLRIFVAGFFVLLNLGAFCTAFGELQVSKENKEALWQKLDEQVTGTALAKELAALDQETQRLFRAAKSGSLDELESALLAGAEPNQRLYGITAAELAVVRAHFDVAERLLAVTTEFDQAFIDAARQFEEAKRVRVQMIESKQDGFFVENKDEVDFLRGCLGHLSKTTVRSDPYYFMLFKSFSRLLQLKAKPNVCMLCLQDHVKIAGSHYISDGILRFISSHWITPESNTVLNASTMTLPLFCTDSKKGDLRCEQRLAKYGENSMAEEFLPFISSIQELVAKNAGSASLNYGSWLYHTISSLAFRVFLSDLENQDNWLHKLERDLSLRTSRQAMWMAIETLREYLMNHEKPSPHRIFLYLSDQGLRKEGELPLVHGIGSGFDGAWHHYVLFSILGFHFVVIPNDESYHAFKQILDSHGGFMHEVKPLGDTISIDVAHDRFLLPELVVGKLEAFNQAWANDMGQANLDLIQEDRVKKKIVVTAQDCGTLPSVAPERIVYLPNFLRFVPNSTRKGFDAGNIVSTNKFVTLKSFSNFPEDRFAMWVFHHERAQYWFTITYVETDDNEIVFGHEFDPSKTTKEVFLKSTEDDYVPDLGIKPLRGTDSASVAFADEDALVWLVGRGLVSYVFGKVSK